MIRPLKEGLRTETVYQNRLKRYFLHIEKETENKRDERKQEKENKRESRAKLL